MAVICCVPLYLLPGFEVLVEDSFDLLQERSPAVRLDSKETVPRSTADGAADCYREMRMWNVGLSHSAGTRGRRTCT
jgi:hypothetical protein